MAEENGLVQIYYGDGKGKTTAAFGLAFRCAGWGRRVVIAQFLKSSPCGELTAAERFPTLTVLRSKGIHKFTFQMNDEEKAVVARNCRKLFQEAVALARAEDARLLVLDEVIDALRGFLPQEELARELVKMTETTPQAQEKPVFYCVMAGAYTSPARRIMEQAGLCTFDAPDKAVLAAKNMCNYAAFRRRQKED